jgi:ankyrin repeat protein
LLQRFYATSLVTDNASFSMTLMTDILLSKMPANKNIADLALWKACLLGIASSNGLSPLLGKRVVIAGIVSRPSVNGKHGVVYEYNEVKGRYAVRLDADGAAMLLKPTNLTALSSANAMSVQDAIAAGADVNYSQHDRSCLEIVATSGNHEMLDLLLKAGVNKEAKDRSGATALLSAAANGHVESTELLLKAGADPNVQNGQCVSALIMAAQNGHGKCVELLATAGANTEAKTNGGFTALIMAAMKGKDNCVELLLSGGANKDAQNDQGFTAMIWAAQESHDKCIKLLLNAGAAKEIKLWQGVAALVMAAQKGCGKCITLLLNAGAKKEAKQELGFTALIFAAQNGHAKCVDILLRAGCDVNATANEGASALVQAIAANRIACVRTLVRAGADVSIEFNTHSLGDIADNCTPNGEALKVALRLPVDKRRRCEQCDTTTSEKMQKCSVCRMVYYCNRECQVAHWKRHTPVCKPAEK